MRYSSLDQCLTDGNAALAKGPVAIVFAEDPVEVETTVEDDTPATWNRVFGSSTTYAVMYVPAFTEVPEVQDCE